MFSLYKVDPQTLTLNYNSIILTKEESEICYLQNYTEVVRRNVILYNVLDEVSFHTIVSNLADKSFDMEVLIWSDKTPLDYHLSIARKFMRVKEPVIAKANFNINERGMYVILPFVIESVNVRVNNENDVVIASLSCKAFIQQTIDVETKMFGLTREGRKWVEFLETLIYKK